MRKAKWLAGVLACGMALGSAIGLAGCGHTHTAGTAWEKDADQHWHVCTEDDEKLDAADHTWNAGEVTKESTYVIFGEKTYTCTVCGQTKKEDIQTKAIQGTYTMSGDCKICPMEAGADPSDGKLSLAVDFEKKEAVLNIYMEIAGVGNMYLITDAKSTDVATSWQYSMATEIGKGTITGNNGAYTATWGEGDTAYTITINVDDNLVCKANVAMANVLAEAAPVSTQITKGTYTMSGDCKICPMEAGADPSDGKLSLAVDFEKKEAVLNIYMEIEGVGNMYLITDVKSTDVATSWQYSMATEIGKGTLTGNNGVYTATWGEGDTAYTITINVNGSVCTASVAMANVLAEAASVTSATAQ